jgi:hypothetical protein
MAIILGDTVNKDGTLLGMQPQHLERKYNFPAWEFWQGKSADNKS